VNFDPRDYESREDLKSPETDPRERDDGRDLGRGPGDSRDSNHESRRLRDDERWPERERTFVACSCRNASACEEGGFIVMTCSIGFDAAHQRVRRKRKEKRWLFGRSANRKAAVPVHDVSIRGGST